jgi:hypothetical protein
LVQMSDRGGSNSMFNMDEYMAQFNAVNEQLRRQQEALVELQKGINNVLISATQSTMSLNGRPVLLASSIKSGIEGSNNDASLLALALKKYGYTSPSFHSLAIQDSSNDLQLERPSIQDKVIVEDPNETASERKEPQGRHSVSHDPSLNNLPSSLSTQNVKIHQTTPLPATPSPPLRMPYMLSRPRVVKVEPSSSKFPRAKASNRLPPRDYPLWKPQWVKSKPVDPTQQKLDLIWWYIICGNSSKEIDPK